LADKELVRKKGDRIHSESIIGRDTVKELVRNYVEWIPSKPTVGRDIGNALSLWLSKVRLCKNNQGAGIADTRV
jgi:hypothetical protein